MKRVVREWVDKAEADFRSAQREYRARNHPNFDAACFFGQQCIEKYLKAKLVASALRVPRTHDLPVLLDLVLDEEPLWESLRPQLELLTAYAVEFRYPGETATREMARDAVACARTLRKHLRQSLGFPGIKRD